jgi:dTDP-4-dehydrorhamnose 3,5-epimerase
MRFTPTEIPEVLLVEPQVFGDERGFFLEMWSGPKFAACGIAAEFVQDNWSRSRRGVLRGLHYQLAVPQGKLVRVVRGSVFDVAVDIRRSSASFGRWVGRRLDAANRHALWIPPGFAHGFLVLEDDTDVVYKCSGRYDPSSERTVAWNDPAIGIAWPLDGLGEPTLSEKDRTRGVPLHDAEVYR